MGENGPYGAEIERAARFAADDAYFAALRRGALPYEALSDAVSAVLRTAASGSKPDPNPAP